MEIPQTFNEFKVWTDDFIIPNDNNLKTIINNPSTSPLFLIEIHAISVKEWGFHRGGTSSNAMIDDSLCEILSSIGVPLHRMSPIITEISSFGRRMMSLPANSGRPLLPIVLLIAVNSWDPTPRGAPERIKDERVCLTPFLGIRYKVDV
ncbi:hypothetical protein H5410_018052 [Solanum commersonii]|uniref:Uncharacterized protein n=1 Tax=Solanum commersonii TaxID=4109 RepID=A0A9J6A230_SOLCO|nr:hypothetical protein H5410_018052 [Solanum commersonii]